MLNLKYQLTVFIMTISLLNSLIYTDVIFKSGNIINETGGSIGFDLNNDTNNDIVMTGNGQLGIGVNNPKSTLEVKGSMGLSIQTLNSDTLLSGNTMILADTMSGNITLTLPTASTVTGRIYQIKKKSSLYDLIIIANDGGNIDDSSSLSLSTSVLGFSYINVFSNGSQWLVSSKSND
jgi:hypothetical protein